MDHTKGCSVTLVAAEEGCYSIAITQRPSDQGRLRAEHELEAANSIRSLPPSYIAPSPKGLVDKMRRRTNNMKRKNPCAKEAQSEKRVHSPQPTNLTIHQEIRWHKRVCKTDSMDGCNVLPQTQFVGIRLRVDTTRVFFVRGSLPPWGAAGERSECNIKPPLGAPLLIFPRGYLLKSFPQVDNSARQRGFEIRVIPLLGELSKTIEPHLPVYQLYRWQLGPNM